MEAWYDGRPQHADGKRAANMLANELVTLTGTRVDADKLADWLRRRWHIVSPLAHTIHNTSEMEIEATAVASIMRGNQT